MRITNGTVDNIELSIPWTSLSSRPAQLKLSQVCIEISLSENIVDPDIVPVVTESEETLLAKVLGNLNLEVDHLTVFIRSREEALYIGQIYFEKLKVITTNENWAEEFTNPFCQIPGGAGYRVWRKIEFTEFNIRLISGKLDESLSEIIVMHKFERVKCPGCPMCYGFKSSSLYTLGSISCASFMLQYYTGSEHSISHSKKHNTQLVKDLSTQQLKFYLSAPLLVKLNLVNDSLFIRDFYGLIEKLRPAESQLSVRQESYSWLSWGKDVLLSPFYCSNPSNRGSLVEKLVVYSFQVSVHSPSIHLRTKIHNPQELETTRFNLSTSEFRSETRLSFSESSEGSIPKQCENITEGTATSPLLSCHNKRDYVIFKSSDTNFSAMNDKLDFQAKELVVQTFVNGNKAGLDACRSSKLSGNMIFGSDLIMNINTDPLSLGFALEEMMIIIKVILEAKAFYSRICNIFVKTTVESLTDILHSHHQQINSAYSNKTQVYESTIQSLKAHSANLANRLEVAEEEILLLRKVLTGMAGSTGLAGLLSIDLKDILCISESAVMEGMAVNLVLTAEMFYVLTNEGRIISKTSTAEMSTLEEKGDSEMTVSTNSGARIKCELKNKDIFTSAIKNIFAPQKNL